jgi:hypothetical protein
MKRLLVFMLLLFCAHTASSQVLIALVFGKKLNSGKLSFGLVGSPMLSTISGIEGKPRLGLDIGLYFDIKLNDRWSLHPEALPKSNFGADKLKPYSTGNAAIDGLYTDGSVTRIIRAMSLPLLVRYRIAGLFYAEAGAQVNLMTKAKDVFKVKVDGNKLNYDYETSDNYTRFDMGLLAGLVYKLSQRSASMSLGLRYYGGLTDMMKAAPGTQLNNAFTFNIYIPVGISPKAEKKTVPK